MERARQLKLGGLCPELTCFLCRGYFVDAFTVVECLHSFCKSCIIAHVKKTPACPRCDTQLNEARLMSALRPDQTLQSVIYKLVPGLFNEEMRRRRDFYGHQQERDRSLSPERRGEVASPYFVFTLDDQVSFSLEYSSWTGTPPAATSDAVAADLPPIRYFQAPTACTIAQLQKLLRRKYDLDPGVHVNISCNSEILDAEWTMVDLAYLYGWDRTVPMKLTYEFTTKRLQMVDAIHMAKRRLIGVSDTPATSAQQFGPSAAPHLIPTVVPTGASSPEEESGPKHPLCQPAQVKVNGTHVNGALSLLQTKKQANEIDIDKQSLLLPEKPSREPDQCLGDNGNKFHALSDGGSPVGVGSETTEVSASTVSTSSKSGMVNEMMLPTVLPNNPVTATVNGFKNKLTLKKTAQRVNKKATSDKPTGRHSGKEIKNSSVLSVRNDNGGLYPSNFAKMDPTINGVVKKAAGVDPHPTYNAAVQNSSNPSLKSPTSGLSNGETAGGNSSSRMSEKPPAYPLSLKPMTEDSGVDTDSSDRSATKEKSSVDVYDFDADAEEEESRKLKTFCFSVPEQATAASKSYATDSNLIKPVQVTSVAALSSKEEYVGRRSLVSPLNGLSRASTNGDKNLRLAGGKVSTNGAAEVFASGIIASSASLPYSATSKCSVVPATVPESASKSLSRSSSGEKSPAFNSVSLPFLNGNQSYSYVTTLSPAWKPPKLSVASAGSSSPKSISPVSSQSSSPHDRPDTNEFPPISIQSDLIKLPRSESLAIRCPTAVAKGKAARSVIPSYNAQLSSMLIPSTVSQLKSAVSVSSSVSSTANMKPGMSLATASSTSASKTSCLSALLTAPTAHQMSPVSSAPAASSLHLPATKLSSTSQLSEFAASGRHTNMPPVSSASISGRFQPVVTAPAASTYSELRSHLAARPIAPAPRTVPSSQSMVATSYGPAISAQQSYPVSGQPFPSSTPVPISIPMSQHNGYPIYWNPALPLTVPIAPPHTTIMQQPAMPMVPLTISQATSPAPKTSPALKVSPSQQSPRQLPALRPINEGTIPMMTNQLNNFLQMVSKSAVSHPNGTWRLPTEASALLNKVPAASKPARPAAGVGKSSQTGRKTPKNAASGSKLKTESAKSLQNLVTSEVTITKLPNKGSSVNSSEVRKSPKQGSGGSQYRGSPASIRPEHVASPRPVASCPSSTHQNNNMTSLMQNKTSSITITSPPVHGDRVTTSITIEKLTSKTPTSYRPSGPPSSNGSRPLCSPKLDAIAENLALRQMQGQMRARLTDASMNTANRLHPTSHSLVSSHSSSSSPSMANSIPVTSSAASSHPTMKQGSSSPPRGRPLASAGARQIPDPSLLHRQSLGRLAVLNVPRVPAPAADPASPLQSPSSSLHHIQKLTNSLGR